MRPISVSTPVPVTIASAVPVATRVPLKTIERRSAIGTRLGSELSTSVVDFETGRDSPVSGASIVVSSWLSTESGVGRYGRARLEGDEISGHEFRGVDRLQVAMASDDGGLNLKISQCGHCACRARHSVQKPIPVLMAMTTPIDSASAMITQCQRQTRRREEEEDDEALDLCPEDLWRRNRCRDAQSVRLRRAFSPARSPLARTARLVDPRRAHASPQLAARACQCGAAIGRLAASVARWLVGQRRVRFGHLLRSLLIAEVDSGSAPGLDYQGCYRRGRPPGGDHHGAGWYEG